MSNLLMKWPLTRQIFNGGDGTGAETMSDATRNLRRKDDGAQVARSVCPYCGVGCGQLIFTQERQVISIEGDPASARRGNFHGSPLTADAASMGAGRARFRGKSLGAGAVGPLKGPTSRQGLG